MSGPIAAALRELVAAGVTGDALVAAVARIEEAMAPQHRMPVAARQANYRKRLKERNALQVKHLETLEKRNALRNVTPALRTNQLELLDNRNALRNAPSPLVPPSPSPLHPPTTTPLNPPTLDFPSENLDRFASIRLEFASFWMRYPHKVGKGAAEKSFLKARQASSFEALMAGLDAYIIARRPDCPWCNPATWLNQLRWLDEPAPPPQATPPPWKKTMMSPLELRRAMGMDAAE